MANSHGFHENLTRTDDVKVGSERSFGLVFTAVFLIVAFWPLLDGEAIRWWSIGVAAVLAAISFVYPAALKPLNRVWFAFGQLLHKITTPVIMALLFYGAIVPTGLLMRLLGKRPLPLVFEAERDSYWIERQPPGPSPDSMPRQF